MAIAGVIGIGCAHAQTLIDFADTSVTQGEINGALFTVDGTHPSGTGIFGRDSGGVFLTIQKNGVEEGYNTSASGIMDTKRIPQWNHEIFVSDLEVVEVDGKFYTPFLLDINESANKKNRLLSLDDVKIFTTDQTGITNPSLDSLLSDPELTLRYDMDVGGDNTVLLDYLRNSSGSGTADMAFLLSMDVFEGAQSSDTVYFYSRFGGDVANAGANFDVDANAGFEEWTQGVGSPNQIPEPSASLLLLMSGTMMLFRRSRVE